MVKVVLECNNLSKKINNKKIIDNVSFNLFEGDILGVIGENGAGKSTIIKTMLGLYKKDGGSLKIMGYDTDNDFVKAVSYVGAIIENPDVYSYMSGYQNLKICQKIYNLPIDRVNEVIKLVGLEGRIYDKVCKYSLGMKQRLGIAQAIIHKPKILILDEPTNGLDPMGIIELKELLIKLSKQGMAIIVSSHILRELESFCNKICIIENGKIIKYTSVLELLNGSCKNYYLLEVDNVFLDKIIDNYEVIDKNHIKIMVMKNEINHIIKKLLFNNIKIYEIKKGDVSLEDVFLSSVRSGIDD